MQYMFNVARGRLQKVALLFDLKKPVTQGTLRFDVKSLTD